MSEKTEIGYVEPFDEDVERALDQVHADDKVRGKIRFMLVQMAESNHAALDVQKAKTKAAYQEGYTEAVRDFGIYKDGVQRIGCLETPIKEVLARKFPASA